jgi:hypothetical protein
MPPSSYEMRPSTLARYKQAQMTDGHGGLALHELVHGTKPRREVTWFGSSVRPRCLIRMLGTRGVVERRRSFGSRMRPRVRPVRCQMHLDRADECWLPDLLWAWRVMRAHGGLHSWSNRRLRLGRPSVVVGRGFKAAHP